MGDSAPILDQSFCVTTTSNLKVLTDLETLIADYATDLTNKEMWLQNDDWNASNFRLNYHWADINEVTCPAGRVVTGIAFYLKGNRLALKLHHANKDGKDRQWKTNDSYVADNTYFYISGSGTQPRFYADSNPLICPPGRILTGVALRMKGKAQFALGMHSPVL
jgi:hypothetical protein